MLWTSALGLLGVLAAVAAAETTHPAASNVFAVAPLQVPPLKLKGSEPSSPVGQRQRLRTRLESLTRGTSHGTVECAIQVLVADPDVDRDFARPAPRDLDPDLAKPSGCRSPEVRHLK